MKMDAFISTQAFRSPFLACPAMGRSRVRGKKQTSTASRQDHASGEEEKIPVKRRGRPLKLVRNDSPQKEAHDFDQLGDEDYTDGILSDKHINAPPSVINTGIKRTRTSDIDDNHGMAKQEIGADIKNNNNDPVKLVGFRQIGSRRKNKPRRAAEVGLECR